MNAEELKRIHGDDVELAPDDSKDDKLTEDKALQQAASEGVYFKDTYYVVKVGQVQAYDDDGFDSQDAAERHRSTLEDRDQYQVVTVREQATKDTQNTLDHI